ncbi:hypothetical protein L7F22_050340 [Adiantum nelumboides]|nr:hypothetical protein [Adiantum nelumboides]
MDTSLSTLQTNYINKVFSEEEQLAIDAEFASYMNSLGPSFVRAVATREEATKFPLTRWQIHGRIGLPKLCRLALRILSQEVFTRLTFDSICEVGFGVEMGTLSASMPIVPFAKAFDSATGIVAKRFFNPLWKLQRLLNIGAEAKLKEDVLLLNQFTSTLIRKRREEIDSKACHQMSNNEHSDLLSRFLMADKESTTDRSNMRLRDLIINFVIAGRDTTSIALSWFLYVMSHEPQVQDKILQELHEIWQKGEERCTHSSEDHNHENQGCCKRCIERYGASLSFEALANMHYLHATLCETLRLYPVVPEDGKTAYQRDVLPDGTRVNRGDVVLFAPYAMGRMTNLWGTDALEFKPERWLKDDVFEPQSPFKFSAFQAGPRICLGKDFAFLQMKMTAAILLKYFKFHLVTNDVVTYKVALTLSMSKALQMSVECR